MRAHEYLFEHSDVRTTLQKLKDVIDHPNTESNIRDVAQRKYDLLISQQVVDEEESVALAPLPVSRITVPVNVEEEYLDQQFVTGISMGDIYERLCSLQPIPSNIEFRRSGVIYITVPPPYCNLTKADYVRLISETVPGIRYINASALENDCGMIYGYVFSLHYI